MGQEEKEQVAELSNEEVAAKFNADGAGAGAGTEHDSKSIFPDEDIVGFYKEVAGEKYSDDFFKDEKGEVLGKKEVLKKIYESNKPAANEPKYDDDFINDYLKLKEEGLTKEDFIKKLNITNKINEMPNKEYLTLKLKEEGLKEEEIKDYLDSKHAAELTLMAKDYKSKDAAKIDGVLIAENKKAIEKTIADNKANNLKIESAITTYYTEKEEALKKNLNYSDDEFKEFLKEANSLLSHKVVKTNNGYANIQGLDEVLSDDNKLFELLPFIVKSKNGKLSDYIRSIKTSIKDQEFERLEGHELNPGEGRGSSGRDYMTDFLNGN